MCGLTISINIKREKDILLSFDKSLDNISHRGPDANQVIDLDKVILGHARLSIIDPSSRSNQPFLSNDKSCYIVFNGEIYNYKDLKSELQDWNFRTESDTEVILAAYSKWGKDCFNKFIGQFAIAIYDVFQNKLVICRDRMGEKPLYYHVNESGLFFSSEIKGLLPFLNEKPSINLSAFNDYLHYQYVPEPDSIISSVNKVEAGTILEYDILSLKKKVTTFWSWDKPSQIDDKNIQISDIEKSLEDSIVLSLVSDVPVAMGLSAGLDSSAIAYYAKKNGIDLVSFTIGYPGKPSYDERDGAALFAKHIGIKNFQVEVDPNEFTNNFFKYCSQLAEPIADAAGYGHYMVPKTISDYGYKVMLSGIGGDELFWGYEWTRLAILYEKIINFKINDSFISVIKRQQKILSLIMLLSRTSKSPSLIRPYFRILHSMLVNTTPKNQGIFMGISGAPEFTSLVSVGDDYFGDAMKDCQSDPYRHTRDSNSKNQLMNVLSKLNKTWLISNSIQLSDSVSMASSVESRSPFLNPDLIKKMLSYNINNQINFNEGKTVLKKILNDKLPKSVINKPKSGFVVPIVAWVNSLEKDYKSQVNNGLLVELGLIKKNFLNIKTSQNITNHTKYRVILLELWFLNIVDLYKKNNAHH
jgi:asparagine synthase (glutamine-hydrolysing)